MISVSDFDLLRRGKKAGTARLSDLSRDPPPPNEGKGLFEFDSIDVLPFEGAELVEGFVTNDSGSDDTID